MLGGKALREAFFLVSNLICSQSEKLKCKCFMQRPCSFFASPQIIQLCHRCLTWCSSPHWLSLQQWRNTSTKAGIIWPSSSPLATTLCKEKRWNTPCMHRLPQFKSDHSNKQDSGTLLLLMPLWKMKWSYFPHVSLGLLPGRSRPSSNLHRKNKPDPRGGPHNCLGSSRPFVFLQWHLWPNLETSESTSVSAPCAPRIRLPTIHLQHS